MQRLFSQQFSHFIQSKSQCTWNLAIFTSKKHETLLNMTISSAARLCHEPTKKTHEFVNARLKHGLLAYVRTPQDSNNNEDQPSKGPRPPSGIGLPSTNKTQDGRKDRTLQYGTEEAQGEHGLCLRYGRLDIVASLPSTPLIDPRRKKGQKQGK